ncbi:MAG TPA: YihY/virulence factor BrkB family protein [Ohtaekwangia sp.]|nr:YihY/virulence factor BrkB family protein [Ohtaekwangia sp.]
MKQALKNIAAVSKNAFVLLRRNDPLILAAATAFFATFSISPIIVILVNVFSLYFKSNVIRQRLFRQLETILGERTTEELEKIVQNFMALKSTWWITIAGFVFLLFVATTLLGVIRKAIHQLWRLRRKSSIRLKYGVKERLVGLAMLSFIGLLFLVSQLLDASMIFLRDYLSELIPSVDAVIIRLINIVFSLLVVTAWFSLLFKLLPEASIRWRVAFAGGFVTALLFTAGKFLLGRFLINSNIENIFGASASIAVLLLFIFYASLIMYYGAAFTYVYGKSIDKPIIAGRLADEYEERTVVYKKAEKSG